MREDTCKFNEMNIPKHVINLYNSNNNNNNSNNLTIRFLKWAENLNRHFFQRRYYSWATGTRKDARHY